MSAYLGFAADLRRLLDRLLPLADEYADDFKAAAALMPGLDAKVRDQLATEHLVHCFRREHGGKYIKALPKAAVQRAGGRGTRQRNRTTVLLAELGVTSGDVRAWAIHQGLLTTITRGQIAYDLVELYALAHEHQKERAG